MVAICSFNKYSAHETVGPGPAQPAQPDEMPQICSSKTDEMLVILWKVQNGRHLLLQKYSGNKIVRAGPAQPAQLDGMHQICFSKTNETSDMWRLFG